MTNDVLRIKVLEAGWCNNVRANEEPSISKDSLVAPFDLPKLIGIKAIRTIILEKGVCHSRLGNIDLRKHVLG